MLRATATFCPSRERTCDVLHPTRAAGAHRRRRAGCAGAHAADSRGLDRAARRPRAEGEAPDPRSPPHQPPHPRRDLDRGLLPLPAVGARPRPPAGQAVPRAAHLGPTLRPSPLLGSHGPRRAVVPTSARASARRSRSAAGSAVPAAHGDLCLQGTTSCAAPWNWFAKFIDARQRELIRRFVNPCAKGGLEGGGVVAATDLSARILLEGGVLTAARAGSIFGGPPGIALGALSGCMVGEASGGLHSVKALVGRLNPLDRTAHPHG